MMHVGVLPTEQGALIAATVCDLRELVRETTIDFSLKVGELVIQRFYGGDVERWRRRGKNCPPLRALTRRKDLPISVSALYRCIALYELGQRLGGFSTWKHLGVSHLRAVLGLPQREQQHMLELAEANRWTVTELDRQVSSTRIQLVRGGRPRLPPWLKSIRRLNRVAAEAEGALGCERSPEEDTELAELRATAASLERLLSLVHEQIDRQNDRPSDRQSHVDLIADVTADEIVA